MSALTDRLAKLEGKAHDAELQRISREVLKGDTLDLIEFFITNGMNTAKNSVFNGDSSADRRTFYAGYIAAIEELKGVLHFSANQDLDALNYDEPDPKGPIILGPDGQGQDPDPLEDFGI